eukprot:gene16707-biopygen16844
MAQAPPKMFTFSGSTPSDFSKASGTHANASLTSKTSMSATRSPALCKAFRLAAIGPSSPSSGFDPTAAIDTIRARGLRLYLYSATSFTIRHADAPSLACELVAAVTTPPGCSGRSACRADSVVAGRTHSSRSNTEGPPAPGRAMGIATISRRVVPDAWAAAAFRCERAAKASSSVRVISYVLAMSSALSNWFHTFSPAPAALYFRWRPSLWNGVLYFMPAIALPTGTLLIDSTPHAMTTS